MCCVVFLCQFLFNLVCTLSPAYVIRFLLFGFFCAVEILVALHLGWKIFSFLSVFGVKLIGLPHASWSIILCLSVVSPRIFLFSFLGVLLYVVVSASRNARPTKNLHVSPCSWSFFVFDFSCLLFRVVFFSVLVWFERIDLPSVCVGKSPSWHSLVLLFFLPHFPLVEKLCCFSPCPARNYQHFYNKGQKNCIDMYNMSSYCIHIDLIDCVILWAN